MADAELLIVEDESIIPLDIQDPLENLGYKVLDQALIEEEPEEKLLAAQGKVLIMDDEEIVRKVASEIVQYLGYEVQTTSEGAETIDFYKRAQVHNNPFSVVILDLTIQGGMGGKETMERLLGIDPEVKALVSSGYSEDPIMANFQEYGFKGIISKPYKIKDMQHKLSLVLKN
jgi:two-component system cell cycle sensor histidine kinase/response regulator CckA